MAYIPDSGSVAAWIQSDNASVITVGQGSVATVIVGGSIAASFTPPANQSVSGTVGASVIGNANTTITSIAAALGVVPILSNNTLTPADGNNYAIQEAMGSGGNQLALTVGNYGFNYNGSNWDRVRGNSSIGTLVSTGASSVITVVQGSVAVSVTPPANQSVSGTVGASIIGTVPVTGFPTTQNVSGSVAAFLSGSTNASVITVGTAVANQSVSGTVGASVIGTVPVTGFPANQSVSGTVLVNNGSVVAFQGTSPWTVVSSIAGGIFPVSGSVAATITGNVTVVSSIAGGIFPISGSVAAVVTNTPNVTPNFSSIIAIGAGSIVSLSQGSVITVNQGSVGAVIIGGSIAASFTPPANQSVSGTVLVNNGSVVSFQGGAWSSSVIGSVAAYQSGTWNVFVAGSVATVGTAAANQSVSGTVGASIIGQLPAGTAVLGSVTALQGTNPWLISSVYGNVSGSIAGTYTSSTVATTVTGLAVMFKPNVSSSIMTEISPTWPLPITGAVAASISGTPNVNVAGSVVAFQGSGWSGSVAATITGTPSISGAVTVVGTPSISGAITVVGSVYGTVTLAGTPSISGAITIVGTPSISGTIIATQLAGSILATSATLTAPANQSVSGTVAATESGTWQVSIAGAYASNSASIISALGVLGLGVKNDTFASVLATTDGYYSPHAVGTVGEQIVANAPLSKWVNGTSGGAILTGPSVAVIAAQGTGIYTYVTGVQVVNASANNVYVALAASNTVAAGASIVAYTVAPANGGSNIVFANPIKLIGPNAAFTGSISGVASVFVSAQGFISKT